MKNKEQVYDEQISPLMLQIIAICKENHIAMVCSFALPTEEYPDLSCTTHMPDETGEMPPPILAGARAVKGEGQFAAFALRVTTPKKEGE